MLGPACERCPPDVARMLHPTGHHVTSTDHGERSGTIGPELDRDWHCSPSWA
jgi:hypothetical protein